MPDTQAKKTRKKMPQGAARAASGGPVVRVRMYRLGLGDCFLLTFDPKGGPVHALIDCGSLGATTTDVRIADVVADIRETTKNHLHLLVATHEHKDHVSGFLSCMDDFKKPFTVDNVWLAWTENPRDCMAKKIVKYKGDLSAALAVAANALADRGLAEPKSQELSAAIRSILSFADAAPGALGAGDFAKTSNEAMTFVRTGFGREALYKTPGGAAIEEAWLPGFRFYVLGPPRSEAFLSDLGDDQSRHLYHIIAGLSASAAGNDADFEEREWQMPFDSCLRLEKDNSLAGAAKKMYDRPTEDWRRIDNDWLYAAGDLALQLDSITNNTSLALAIERISDGRVLLFTADAQQGNWLSWHAPNMEWTYTVGSATRKKTAADLLGKTVFYKVGHHASHNATAGAKGLEMMSREDELVAFIPVDRAVALKRNPQNSWQMPARSLYRRLLEKCQGRVVRSDLGFADDASNAKNTEAEKEFLGLADGATWKKWKRAQHKARANKSVKENPLYVDYTLM